MLAAISSVFISTFAGHPGFCAQENAVTKLTGKFGEPISVRGTRLCNIIHTPRINGLMDEGSGYRLSGRDLDELAKNLQWLKHNDLAEGEANVKGVSIYDSFDNAYVDRVRDVIEEVGLKDKVSVKVHYVSRGLGMRRVLERIRMFFPMRQDLEKPLTSEVVTGLPGLFASEMGTATYLFHQFPPEIAVPMATAYFGFLMSFTAYRRMISNWMNRSHSDWESFLKQGLLSGVFVANYKFAVQWPKFSEQAYNEGLTAASKHALGSAGQYIVEQGATTFIQTVFFWLTFNKGVFRWEAMMTQSPRTSFRARRAAALVTPLIYTIAGPVLAWASTNQEMDWHMSGLDLNAGQLALVGLTAAGGGLAMYPRILDRTMDWSEKYFYEPWNRAVYVPTRKFFSRLRTRLREREQDATDD